MKNTLFNKARKIKLLPADGLFDELFYIVQANDPSCVSVVKQSLIKKGKNEFFDL